MAYLLLLISYIIGSLNTSIILCKLLGYQDPRTIGSQNAGATNISRFTNKKITISVLLIDILKGLFIILLARYYFGLQGNILGLIGFAMILGHIYPIFFQFQGGKGVATTIGVLFGLSPGLAIFTLIIWITTIFITHYSSLASLIAITSLTIVSLFFAQQFFFGFLLMAILIILKHKTNIIRLINGTEAKIGTKT